MELFSLKFRSIKRGKKEERMKKYSGKSKKKKKLYYQTFIQNIYNN